MPVYPQNRTPLCTNQLKRVALPLVFMASNAFVNAFPKSIDTSCFCAHFESFFLNSSHEVERSSDPKHFGLMSKSFHLETPFAIPQTFSETKNESELNSESLDFNWQLGSRKPADSNHKALGFSLLCSAMDKFGTERGSFLGF